MKSPAIITFDCWDDSEPHEASWSVTDCDDMLHPVSLGREVWSIGEGVCQWTVSKMAEWLRQGTRTQSAVNARGPDPPGEKGCSVDLYLARCQTSAGCNLLGPARPYRHTTVFLGI